MQKVKKYYSYFIDSETETEKLGEWHFTSLNEGNYINYSSIFSIFNYVACFLRDIIIKVAILGGRDGFANPFQ